MKEYDLIGLKLGIFMVVLIAAGLLLIKDFEIVVLRIIIYVILSIGAGFFILKNRKKNSRKA